MEKKRSAGIIGVSIFLFLSPLFAKMICDIIFSALPGTCKPQSLIEFIRNFWTGFLFYGILGIGILKLNNKIRFLAVAYTTGISIAGPLGLIIGTVLVGPKVHAELIRKYGITVILYPWFAIVSICIIYAMIAFYLTRPKVKEQFR